MLVVVVVPVALRFEVFIARCCWCCWCRGGIVLCGIGAGGYLLALGVICVGVVAAVEVGRGVVSEIVGKVVGWVFWRL